MGVDSRFVQVGSLRLHVVDYGGDGPPLFAVHGTGLVAQVWGVLVPYLTPHFHVYALDRKGHGDSDKSADGYEMETAVSEYVGVVDALAARGGVAIGHSSGATSLGLAAARHPTLFRRLVMLDPIIFPPRTTQPTAALEDASPPFGMVERTRKRRATWPSAQAMFDSLVSKPPFRSRQSAALWDYVRHGAQVQPDDSVMLKCPPELEATMYNHSSRIDLFGALAQMTIPTLIVRGEQTDRFPREYAHRAVATMPRAQLVEMTGLTHFPSMEDPARVAALIVPFLAGTEDDRSCTTTD